MIHAEEGEQGIDEPHRGEKELGAIVEELHAVQAARSLWCCQKNFPEAVSS